jgi:hypothetical protein
MMLMIMVPRLNTQASSATHHINRLTEQPGIDCCSQHHRWIKRHENGSLVFEWSCCNYGLCIESTPKFSCWRSIHFLSQQILGRGLLIDWLVLCSLMLTACGRCAGSSVLLRLD